MSAGYPDPANDPLHPAQQLPPFAPGSRTPGGGPRLGWALWMLVFLFVLWILPGIVEQIRYSYTRGKERAEAEIARQMLDDKNGPTIGKYRYVVKAVQPSVVGVKADHNVGGQANDELSAFLFNRRPLHEQDQGSGVIIDSQGYIITNYHVVEQATDVMVELSDGSPHEAQIVGADPATDLAVLKINAPNLQAATWGKSADLEVGDPVLAIGNPFGLARTVTAGILSATGRHAVVEHLNYQDFLQTDAAVNPGNSGGPLVNMKGEIVGINTAIVGPTYQGISFAIPSDMAHEVYGQLVKSGKVARAWLGVSMKELPAQGLDKEGPDKEDAAKDDAPKPGASGALVNAVMPDSPAAEAGIQPGDVITKFNGKPVSGPAELGLAVAWSKIGEKAKVTVERDDKALELTVKLGRRPDSLR